MYKLEICNFPQERERKDRHKNNSPSGVVVGLVMNSMRNGRIILHWILRNQYMKYFAKFSILG